MPVRLGVPCPWARFFPGEHFALELPGGERRAVQARPLDLWADGSVKWLLTDFSLPLAAGARAQCRLVPGMAPEGGSAAGQGRPIVQEAGRFFRADTGVGVFAVSAEASSLFSSLTLRGGEFLAEEGGGAVLLLADGRKASAVLDAALIEENGPLRATILKKGRFVDRQGKELCNFALRQTFFAGKNICQLDFLLHNPKAAAHPGGVWDLGASGSLFFRELALEVRCREAVHSLEWQEAPGSPLRRDALESWLLYQDSSGLEHWDSVNHIDRDRVSTVSFPGFRVHAATSLTGAPLGQGGQATPYVKLLSPGGWVAATVRDFWQNFPKSLEVAQGVLRVGLFPRHGSGLHELQGGESKRHTIIFEFGQGNAQTAIPEFQKPPVAFPDPVWTESSGAVAGLTIAELSPVCAEYVENIISGPNSFFAKRERIDEYGWRNFGDIYADHEAVHHKGERPFVSHYNNQYDFLYGGIVHFLRTGKEQWFELASDLARHVVDIDIYHTDRDRPAFNHGQFWHTDHYSEAHTCTHRSYSRLNRKGNGPYGGGPSNENDYSTGLLHYYYLTGDPQAREAVLELASWVLAMDDGGKTLFAFFDQGPSGGASQTVDPAFHKPGRGAGNSINTLLDAFRLGKEYAYLEKAEALIRRCIHPRDDVAALGLDAPEYRWSYLVFLQVLGKYLDLKVELQCQDAPYFYARDSLLRYAAWMLDHERPYQELLDRVELPTETWPAQDIRKTHVLYLAAKYAPPEQRSALRARAEFFFHRCLHDLLGYPTAYVTRPLVLLAVYGHWHSYFQRHAEATVPCTEHVFRFGNPADFIPQRSRFLATFGENLRQSLRAAWLLFLERVPRRRG